MNGIFESIMLGLLVKSAASFDDTLTRIPILASATVTRRGKLAFSLGTFLSLTLLLFLAYFFSFVLEGVPQIKHIIAALVLVLAVVVYFELYSGGPSKYVKKKTSNIFQLIALGFVVSLITYLDDMVVMLPLFLGHPKDVGYRVIGIYVALLIQIAAVVYFSKNIEKLKYRKEIAAFALVVLAVLVWFGII